MQVPSQRVSPHEQRSNRANEQSNERANEHTSEGAKEQTSKRTNEQTSILVLSVAQAAPSTSCARVPSVLHHRCPGAMVAGAGRSSGRRPRRLATAGPGRPRPAGRGSGRRPRRLATDGPGRPHRRPHPRHPPRPRPRPLLLRSPASSSSPPLHPSKVLLPRLFFLPSPPQLHPTLLYPLSIASPSCSSCSAMVSRR